jgi:hypothetical protein
MKMVMISSVQLDSLKRNKSTEMKLEIVSFIKELRSDVFKTNKNGVWSKIGQNAFKAYTEMISIFKQEDARASAVQIKMCIGAYMDASRRNSGA